MNFRFGLLPSLVVLVLLASACGSAASTPAADPQVSPSEAAPTESASARPSADPTAEPEALDPECEAAFEESIAQMTEGNFAHLDAAIAACETVEDWRAAAREFFDAIGFRIMEPVFARCLQLEELRGTALCQATEESWAPAN